MNKNVAIVIPLQKEVTKDIELPLGVLHIGTVMKQKGYDVTIYDLTVKKNTEEAMLEDMKKKNITVMGISFGTANRHSAFSLCDRIKKALPKIIIVAGGWHVNCAPKNTIENIKSIDIVAMNEGEEVFPDIVASLENGLKDVKGIWFRKNGKAHFTGKRDFIKNLDSIPWVDRSLVNLEDYNQRLPWDKKTKSTSIITSRGCPYQCIYCSTATHWGRMNRYRSVRDVVDEIEHIVNVYGIRGIEFRDDTFTLNKKRVIEFCNEILKRKLDIKWWCETRANTIDRETVKLMKKAGCYYMAMAIESANDKTIKIIKKGITVQQAKNVVEMITGEGIILKTFFMFGLPEEGEKEIRNTAFLIRHLKHKYGVKPIYSITTIYPSTVLEAMAKEKGIIPKDFDWSARVTTNPKQMYNLYFAPEEPLYQEDGMPYERLARLIRKSFMLYYVLHPVHFVRDMWEYRKQVGAWLK